MGNVIQTEHVSNAIARVLVDALKIAMSDPDVATSFRALMAGATTSTIALTRKDLAKKLNLSISTIDRFVAASMPSVGDGRHRRFDLEACRSWIAARPQGAVRNTIDGEVAALARRAGLRVAGGER